MEVVYRVYCLILISKAMMGEYKIQNVSCNLECVLWSQNEDKFRLRDTRKGKSVSVRVTKVSHYNDSISQGQGVQLAIKLKT